MNCQNRQLLWTVAVHALCAGFVTPAFGAAQWKGEISRDYVHLDDGKFVIDEYDICKFLLPERLGGKSTDNFQVRTYAEAPAKGVVSRDYFALASGQYSNLFVLGLAQAVPGLTLVEAISGLRCRTMEAPIGTVDLEVKILMTADGVQFEIEDTKASKKSRSTRTWAELYSESD